MRRKFDNIYENTRCVRKNGHSIDRRTFVKVGTGFTAGAAIEQNLHPGMKHRELGDIKLTVSGYSFGTHGLMGKIY